MVQVSAGSILLCLTVKMVQLMVQFNPLICSSFAGRNRVTLTESVVFSQWFGTRNQLCSFWGTTRNCSVFGKVFGLFCQRLGKIKERKQAIRRNFAAGFMVNTAFLLTLKRCGGNLRRWGYCRTNGTKPTRSRGGWSQKIREKGSVQRSIWHCSLSLRKARGRKGQWPMVYYTSK